MELTKALKSASKAKRGIRNVDVTNKGFDINTLDDLEIKFIIFPKLYRRLTEHLIKNGGILNTFLDFPEGKNDELHILDEVHEKILKDIITVKGNRVIINKLPEEELFVPQG